MEHEWHYQTKNYDGVVQDCHIQAPVPRDKQPHDGLIKVRLLGDGRAVLCETMSSVVITVDLDEIHSVKFIVHNEQAGIFTGFVVPDHYGRTYETYYKLIDVAKRAFPKLEKRDIELLSVTRSGAYEGMPVIRFRVPPVSEVR